MDLAEMCERSFYQEIYRYEGTDRSIVLDTTTDHVYLKKELSVYNREVFGFLKENRSPHIPEIHTFWEENGRLTVIEEFIQGETLSSLLDRHAPDRKETLRILRELCDGLEFLHKADPPIIHRDLKPSNVMIADDGTVKLIDYDAAKLFHPDESEDTVLMGTKGSAAPEQYGFGQSDVRTDVYGMGTLIRRMAPENARLQRVAARATELDPDNRYQSIAELRRAVSGAAGFGITGISGKRSGRYRRSSADSGSSGSGKESTRSYGGEPIGIGSVLHRIPGFRTGIWWKKAVAVLGYAAIADLAITAPVNSGGVPVTNPVHIAVFRICIGLALLAVVDMFTEGSWIARHLPFKNSDSPFIWLLVHSAAAFAGFFFWAFFCAMVTEFL